MLGFPWLACVGGGSDRASGETGGFTQDDLPSGALILDQARLVDATGVREGALILEGGWTEHGLVAPDYRADLLVVDGRPDEEIQDTQSVHAILRDGEWHTPDSFWVR